jgi:hypothetical protein
VPDIQEDGSQQIDLVGCIALAEKIREILRLKSPAVNKTPEPDSVVYLQQLSRLNLGPKTDRNLDARSRFLCEKERRLESRESALQSVGLPL